MKPVIFFIHGIGGAGEAFARHVSHFSDRYTPIGWDVPGYGGRPMPDDMSFESICQTLMDDLDAAGGGKAILVGHSFGGMVAQVAVRMFPEKISGLVLCGTSTAFGSADGEFQRKFMAARLAPLEAGKTLADIAPTSIRGLASDDADEEGITLGIKCMSEVPEATYRKVLELLAGFDERSNLAKITCPTLLISGENDAAAPAQMMERMAGKIPGSKYEMMAGCGHFMALERPDKFNAIIDTFLEEASNG
ncbi:MAG: alpha/beta fold hydrolase [Hyphomicrobiales bacterium]